MTKKHAITLLLAMTMTLSVTAQTSNSWEEYLDELIATDDESGDYEETFHILSDLAEHPININKATREDLEQIPFLSAQQIEDLLAYVYQYGGFKSMGELQMIASLDHTRMQLLPNFLYINNTETSSFPSLKSILRHGKQQVIATLKAPLYQREGDTYGYLGYKYEHSLRYDFSYGNLFKVGLLASQDASEPFFACNNRAGYDYYSFYALVRNAGCLKTLALGRYKIRMGMGLVINSDISFGKLFALSSLSRNGNSIRAHSSRSESNYLQGGAATVSISHDIDITAFASWRYVDATLNKDGSTISTIVTSGYHRTPKEMSKKGNTTQTTMGGNVNWAHNGFHIGLSALYTKMNRDLKPHANQLYRYYYPRGNHFWNAGINYGYISGRLAINGETATGSCHGWATINTISYKPSSTLTLLGIQRFYSYKYYSLFSNSFADGGRTQNESGLYAGATWQPIRNLSVTAYIDYCYSPWPRYQVSTDSHSWDTRITATYKKEKYTIEGQYRMRLRQKDNAGKTALINDQSQKGSIAFTWNGWHGWKSKTKIDIACDDYKTHSVGWMISQSIDYKPLTWLNVAASSGYFHTRDYNSRIYNYERGMLYNFGSQVFYGHGMRFTLFTRLDMGKNIILILKYGTTKYFDRDYISSGLQQIDSNRKTDLEVQLKWKF